MVYVDLSGVPECQKITQGIEMAQLKNKFEKSRHNEEKRENEIVKMFSGDKNDDQNGNNNINIPAENACVDLIQCETTSEKSSEYDSDCVSNFEFDSIKSCSKSCCLSDHEVERSETKNLINNESNFVLSGQNSEIDDNNALANANQICVSNRFGHGDYEIEFSTENNSLEKEYSPPIRVSNTCSSVQTNNVALNLSTSIEKDNDTHYVNFENSLNSFETSVTQYKPSVLDSPVSISDNEEIKDGLNDTLSLPNCFFGGFEEGKRQLHNIGDLEINPFDDDDYDTTIIVRENDDDDDSVIILQTEHGTSRSNLSLSCPMSPNTLWTEPRMFSSLSDVPLIDVNDASLWEGNSLLGDCTPSMEYSPFKDIASLNDFSLMEESSPSPLQDVSPMDGTSLISTRDNSPSEECSPLKRIYLSQKTLASPGQRTTTINDSFPFNSPLYSKPKITSPITNDEFQIISLSSPNNRNELNKNIPIDSKSTESISDETLIQDGQCINEPTLPVIDKDQKDLSSANIIESGTVQTSSYDEDRMKSLAIVENSSSADKSQEEFETNTPSTILRDSTPALSTTSLNECKQNLPQYEESVSRIESDINTEIPVNDEEKPHQKIINNSLSPDKIQENFVRVLSIAANKVSEEILQDLKFDMGVKFISTKKGNEQKECPLIKASSLDSTAPLAIQSNTDPGKSTATDNFTNPVVPTVNMPTQNNCNAVKKESICQENVCKMQKCNLPFNAEKYKSRGILTSCQVPKSVAEVPEGLMRKKEFYRESPLKTRNSINRKSLKSNILRDPCKRNSWRDFKLNTLDITNTLLVPDQRQKKKKPDDIKNGISQNSKNVNMTQKQNPETTESSKNETFDNGNECESFGPRFFADMCSFWPDIIVRLAHDITLESPSVEDAPDPPDPPSFDTERRQSCDGEEASVQSPRPVPNSPRPQPEGKCCSDEDQCCPQVLAEHTSELRAAATAAATGSPKHQVINSGPCLSAGLQPASCPSPICGSPAPRKPRPVSSSGPSSVESVESTDTCDLSMAEFFSGDLDDLLEIPTSPDGNDGDVDGTGKSSGSWDQKPNDRNERKRRKLPEIPKNKKSFSTASILALRSGPTLAEELHDAESGVASRSSTPDALTLINNHSRPILVLKCHSYIRDDSSSPDSELRLPLNDIDSGNSTQHSPDGLKSMSPQATVNESLSPMSPGSGGVPFPQLELLEATHRGLYRFIPRHHDEVEIEIGDPIYVQKEADDLWCEGVNLRTGRQGIFPGAHVTDVDYSDFDPSVPKVKKERYLLNYLGSIETLCHKGNQVLCQAVRKIAGGEESVQHPHPCILEVSDQGIRMVDKSKPGPNHVPCHDYFYHLKHVSFCAFHPKDHRYFGFITKHPTIQRFACHVFRSNDSTRPVAEAVGRAFQRFYQKFIETAYPIEDIYLE